MRSMPLIYVHAKTLIYLYAITLIYLGPGLACRSGKLQELDLLHKARLSVQRVSKADWDFILTLEQEEKDS